jgi:hypothetical protein
LVRDVERLFYSIRNFFEANKEAKVYFDDIVLALAIPYFDLI